MSDEVGSEEEDYLKNADKDDDLYNKRKFKPVKIKNQKLRRLNTFSKFRLYITLIGISFFLLCLGVLYFTNIFDDNSTESNVKKQNYIIDPENYIIDNNENYNDKIIEENDDDDNINEDDKNDDDNVDFNNVVDIPKKKENEPENKKNAEYNEYEQIDNDLSEIMKRIEEHSGFQLTESEIYIKKCQEGILTDTNKYRLSEKPKVSIILTMYNKEKYVLPILRSIQNQDMKDIEIIFVDDVSTDKTVQIIEENMQKDERIRLIKHTENKSCFQSRLTGIRNAKGEYIIIVDGDDLVLEHGIKDAYDIAKAENLDIVEFNFHKGEDGVIRRHGHKHKEGILTQPKIVENLFKTLESNFERIRLDCIYIWHKLFKREVVLKGLESLDSFYLNQRMSIYEDSMLLYTFFKQGTSYRFINVYGYFYNLHEDSLTRGSPIEGLNDQKIHDCFVFLKFFHDFLERTAFNGRLLGKRFKMSVNGIIHLLHTMTKNFNFAYEVIDLYYNDEIIPNYFKRYCKKIKGKIQYTENKLKETK